MDDRLYLADAYLRAFEAAVVESASGWCRLSRTAFYPGGGGQPHDRGTLAAEGAVHAVAAVREDERGRIWHQVGLDLPAGAAVRGEIDWPYRHLLMRHHGLLHVVNAVALRDFAGAITGAQIGAERSRIDLRLASFSRERIPDLERSVNEVVASGLPFSAAWVAEAELRSRPELVRTLNVLPPAVDGSVRVVEIGGFDAQACGGTHVHSTAEIGPARVTRFDNKGRDNKRFYWELLG
jgi:misacylated tRNA(Ala) deacylase